MWSPNDASVNRAGIPGDAVRQGGLDGVRAHRNAVAVSPVWRSES